MCTPRLSFRTDYTARLSRLTHPWHAYRSAGDRPVILGIHSASVLLLRANSGVFRAFMFMRRYILTPYCEGWAYGKTTSDKGKHEYSEHPTLKCDWCDFAAVSQWLVWLIRTGMRPLSLEAKAAFVVNKIKVKWWQQWIICTAFWENGYPEFCRGQNGTYSGDKAGKT